MGKGDQPRGEDSADEDVEDEMTEETTLTEADDYDEEEEHLVFGIDVTTVVDGVDLTGDTKVTHSNWFASGVFALVLLLCPVLWPVISSSPMVTDSKFGSLIIFLSFLTFSVLGLVVAAAMGLGNSKRLQLPCLEFISAGVLVAFYVFGLILRLWVRWLPWIESEPTSASARISHLYQMLINIVLEVCNLGVTVFLLVELCRLGGLCGGVNFKDEIALEKDADGQWGNDDVKGLIEAARVKDDLLSSDKEEFLVYPGLVQTLKEHWYPQPFAERHKFPDTEHLRTIAERAVITYPPRFKLGCLSALVLISVLAIGNLWFCTAVVVNQDLQEEMAQRLNSAVPKLADAKIKLAAMQTQLAMAQQNFTQALGVNPSAMAQQGMGMNAATMAQQNAPVLGINAAVQNQVATTQQLQSLDILHYAGEMSSINATLAKLEDFVSTAEGIHDAAVSTIRRSAACGIFAVPVGFFIACWFLYASRLAYRKGLLELALSMPHYRFHPKWQNFASDKKFLGMYISCFVLGYILMVATWWSVAFLVSNIALWAMVLKYYWDTLLATSIYYVFSLVALPQLHSYIVSKDGRLYNPRMQALLVFVFEIFYAPQMAVSVVLHVVCVCLMAMCMLLRPDQFVMRTGWEWLDMMFFVYASMQHEQLNAAIRKHEGHIRTATSEYEESIGDEVSSDAVTSLLSAS